MAGSTRLATLALMSDPTYSLTHLLSAFRRALQAMAPVVQSVGLTWRDGEAHDEWDALAENLFDVLVVSAICGDPQVGGVGRPVGRYGFGPTPGGPLNASWIEVDVPERPGTHAFVDFGSDDDFGVVHVVRVDRNRRWTGEAGSVKWTPQRTFGLRLGAAGAVDLRVDRVTPSETVWPIPRSAG